MERDVRRLGRDVRPWMMRESRSKGRSRARSAAAPVYPEAVRRVRGRQAVVSASRPLRRLQMRWARHPCLGGARRPSRDGPQYVNRPMEPEGEMITDREPASAGRRLFPTIEQALEARQ